MSFALSGFGRFALVMLLILPPGTGYGADIIHHDIEARIDPWQGSITVTDVLTVAAQSPPQQELLGFFLNRHLELSEVSALNGAVSFTIHRSPRFTIPISRRRSAISTCIAVCSDLIPFKRSG